MDRVDQAVALLKDSKAKGLSYYDATQSLAKQGFTPAEIEQASYRFTYSDADPAKENEQLPPTANQAAAEEIVHEEAVESAKSDMRKDIGLSLLGGRSLFGSYFRSKAISDYAAYKDLENKDPLSQPDNSGSAQAAAIKPYVFQRHTAVKIYGLLSFVPLLVLAPYVLPSIGSLPHIFIALVRHHDRQSLALYGMFLWMVAGVLSYACIPVLLFLSKKEQTISNGIYIIMAVDALFFALIALIGRQPILLVYGLILLLPEYWISRRVGLLSQLG
jgi:hypothetical protein